MKIVTVIGARPQFVKASAVSRSIEDHNRGNGEITEILVHTGQHYDYNMSQVFFDQLKIPAPRHHLGVKSGSHGEMTGAMLARIEPVLVQEAPDFVLTYGDTNSTLAGALAASKLHIPVVHIEAGLRSFNRLMPEEINRVLTDHLSTHLFCPTDAAVANLEKEGITRGVFKVGDVMFDVFLFCRELACTESTILPDLGLDPGSYYLATVHRQENSDSMENLTNILSAFEELSSQDGCPVVFPVHPRTRKNLMERGDGLPATSRVRLIPPVSYLDMIALEVHARLILTDSGGVQKEAYFSGVPCVTLRNETEWIETVEAGWNRLAGTELARIVAACGEALDFRPSEQFPFYGNGNAGQDIVEQLVSCS